MMPSICTSKQYRWYIIDYKTTQISQEILLEMHSVHHMKVELQFCSSSFEWDCSAEAEDMKLFLFHGAASLHNDTPWSLPDSMTFLLSFLSCCIWLDDFIIDMNSLPKRCSSARSCGLTKDLQNKIYIFFILFIYFFWHSLHSDSFQSSCLARITQGKKGIKKKKKVFRMKNENVFIYYNNIHEFHCSIVLWQNLTLFFYGVFPSFLLK